MQTLSLIQGTPEWLAHRAVKGRRNASEAAAALGVHPLLPRNEFLAAQATGVSRVFSEYLQKFILDEGHRAEGLARPLAEKIIGDELSPVTGVEGDDSASFDGITFMDIWFEHKLLNAELREILSRPGVTCTDLPLYHQIQMESQAKVCGGEKGLFMASNWDDEGNLIEEFHVWYYPNLDLRARIDAGWVQFFKDRDNYKPSEITEMPKAEVTINLPALFVHAQGVITENNMDAFGAALSIKLAEVRSIAYVTDLDFSNAKEGAKKFRETAKAIVLAKEQMLANTQTIGEAARKMDAWAKDLNETALQLEKDVKERDLQKKRAMVMEATQSFTEHVAALELEIKPIRMNMTCPDFAESIKGKSKYSSMQNAIDTDLSTGKIDADARAKDYLEKLAWCKEHAAGMSTLFPDLQVLMTKPLEDFTLTIQSRIDKQKADEVSRLEAERVRIQAEEEIKARAKMEAEERARVDSETKAQLEDQAAARVKEAKEVAYMQEQTNLNMRAAPQQTDDVEARRKAVQLAEQAKPVFVGVDMAKPGSDIAMVSITQAEYDRLVERDDWLGWLEAAGVDNWQGIDEAISMRNESRAGE